MLAFVLSVAILGVAGVIFHAKSHELAAGQREAAAMGQSAVRSPDRPARRLQGGQAQQVAQRRLYDDVVEVSRNAANIKIRTQSETFKRLVFSQTSMYLLLASIVFVVPTLSNSADGSITKTTTALMFVVGVCIGLVQTIPILTAANAAADNIERLEDRLRAIASEVRRRARGCRCGGSTRSRCANILFRYVDKLSEAVFQVGPVDFTLRAGELVFITGGNGSGKSTFLKVLAGLYTAGFGQHYARWRRR